MAHKAAESKNARPRQRAQQGCALGWAAWVAPAEVRGAA